MSALTCVCVNGRWRVMIVVGVTQGDSIERKPMPYDFAGTCASFTCYYIWLMLSCFTKVSLLLRGAPNTTSATKSTHNFPVRSQAFPFKPHSSSMLLPIQPPNTKQAKAPSHNTSVSPNANSLSNHHLTMSLDFENDTIINYCWGGFMSSYTHTDGTTVWEDWPRVSPLGSSELVFRVQNSVSSLIGYALLTLAFGKSFFRR